MVDATTAQLWAPELKTTPATWLHESGPIRVTDSGVVCMHGNNTGSYSGADPIQGAIFHVDVYAGPDAPTTPNIGNAYKFLLLSLDGSRQADAFASTTGTFDLGADITEITVASPDAADLSGSLLFDALGLVADVSADWTSSQFGGTNVVRCVFHNGTPWYTATYRGGGGGQVFSTTPGAAPGTSGSDNREADVRALDWVSDGTYIWSVGGANPNRLTRWDPSTDTVDNFSPLQSGVGTLRAIGLGQVEGQTRLLMMGSFSPVNRIYIVDPADPTNNEYADLSPWPTGSDGPLAIDYDPVWDRWIVSFDSQGHFGRGIWQIRFGTACTPVVPEPLFIPFKDRLKKLEGDFTDAGIKTAQDHQFENWKVIERWAGNWMTAAASAEKCNCFVPFKEHSNREQPTSASQSFEDWKYIERWAYDVATASCGCSCADPDPPPDRCLLHVPFKDHLLGGDLSDPEMIRKAAEQEFDNFKTLERWANRYASGECVCSGGGTPPVDCFHFLGTPTQNVHDVTWHNEVGGDQSIWVHSGTNASNARFRRHATLDFTLIDTIDPTTSQTTNYVTDEFICTDVNGSLIWTETINPVIVTPTETIGIRVHQYDIANDIDTIILDVTAAGSPNAEHHHVTGLEFKPGSSNKIWMAWNYSEAGSEYWELLSFDTGGGSVNVEASGTTTFPEFLGPLIFDPDGVSLWGRSWPGSGGTFYLGHYDMGTTAISRPAGADGVAVEPSFPVDPESRVGVSFQSIEDDGWRAITYDNPGFTIEAHPCNDNLQLGPTAYYAMTGAWLNRAAFGTFDGPTSGTDVYTNATS